MHFALSNTRVWGYRAAGPAAAPPHVVLSANERWRMRAAVGASAPRHPLPNKGFSTAHVHLSKRLGYLKEEKGLELDELCDEVTRVSYGWMKAIERSVSPVHHAHSEVVVV